MSSVEDTKSRMITGPKGPREIGTAYLLVVENDTSRIVQLPREGQVSIGRSSEADVTLEHASVSRKHANISIEDGVMRIADLGSHNGTRVNGERVQQSRTLSSGDVIGVEKFFMVVHCSTPPVVSRTTYAEAGWRRRLAEELDRAITYKRSLAVLAVMGVDPSVVAGLGESLRLIDVVGEGEDHSALLLLPEADREQARVTAAGLLESLKGQGNVRLGLAVCPTDACDADTIMLAVRKAVRRAEPGTFAEAAEAATQLELGPRTVMVLDPAMSRVYDLLERLAANTQLPVLINGETGVGKENAAYAVHHWSKRTGPFQVVDCTGFTEALADSALFGHEKGAFTGATTAKAGYFEAAAGGTIFLDELGELPLPIQAKLLRVLQNKTITRVGETRERTVDVRVVAATNRNLEAEVTAGRFRQDLFFRLAAAKVVLPPLRDRQCEIPLLARRFLAAACQRAGRKPMTITPEAMQLLLCHKWPGNVRELENEIDRASAIAPDDCIEPSDLSEKFGNPQPAGITGKTVALAPTDEVPATFRPVQDELDELEKLRMVQALRAADGVKTKAAQLIGMPIRTFTHKLKQYKL